MRARRYGWLTAVLLGAAGCATHRVQGPVVDTEIRDLAGSAQAAYQRGDIGRAAQLYARALERARRLDDTRETAGNAYNLALCRMAGGQTAEARALLAQARGLLPAQGAETARTWLADAEAAGREANPDAARRFAQRALDVGADREGRAQARLVLAALAGNALDWADAARLLAAARKDLKGTSAPALQARADGLAAVLAVANSDRVGVAAALERQAGWLREAGDYQAMAEALLGAGLDYRTAGQPQKAYPCLLRAAASLKAAGASARAETAAAAALAVARELSNPDWAAAAEALASEIRRP